MTQNNFFAIFTERGTVQGKLRFTFCLIINQDLNRKIENKYTFTERTRM